MAFAGGPFNNFVLQATAGVIEQLRAQRGARGLVTTVSGMLSKPGLAVWSATAPSGEAPGLVADLAEAAKAATPTVDIAGPESSHGPATVVSFTVTYDEGGPDRLRPVRTAIVADLDDGRRTAAACENETLARHAIAESLIGQRVHIEGATFTI